MCIHTKNDCECFFGRPSFTFANTHTHIHIHILLKFKGSGKKVGNEIMKQPKRKLKLFKMHKHVSKEKNAKMVKNFVRTCKTKNDGFCFEDRPWCSFVEGYFFCLNRIQKGEMD